MILFKCDFVFAGSNSAEDTFFAYGARFASEMQCSLTGDGMYP
jgi:hypothetical protein